MLKSIGLTLFLTIVSTFGYAQSDVFSSKDLFNMNMVRSVSISPDGKYIAYSQSVPRPWTDKPGGDYSELYVMDVATGTTKPYISGSHTFYSVKWTPDSKHLTMLGRFNDIKSTQIFTMDINGGMPVQVTDIDQSIRGYDWNPKNNTIAIIGLEKEGGNSMEKKGFDAEIYEEDFRHQNLYIYDIGTKEIRQITEGFTVYSIQWNPAGDRIAAQTAEKNLTDYSYMFKRLELINPATKEVKQIVDHNGKMTSMKWSPDGKHLALVSGVDINDPVDGSLYVIPIPNTKKWAELKNWVDKKELSVTSIEWKDEKTLLFSADESVNTSLSEQAIGSDERKVLIEGGNIVFGDFAIAGNTIALSADSRMHPHELFTFDLKKKELKRRTNNNTWLKDRKLGKQEKVSYKARDGVTVEGVLIYPTDYKAGTKYPMICYIHGGPESCVKEGWSTYYSMWGQVAAGKGFFVFMPNYRGSSGRGVAYSKMDQKDMGDEEFLDVLDGIEHLSQKGLIDKSRVGIGGGSYGGYFGAWAATKHSDHFAAAVAFVGISDQISKRFTTDIPWESYYSHWLMRPEEDWEFVLDRSPIKYATNNKTPTLILHGKEDPRVHPSQSLELYRAIKMNGKGPVRLVWYPGEGHGNRKNPARLDYNLRTMQWFEHYLKGNNSLDRDKMPDKELDYDID